MQSQQSPAPSRPLGPIGVAIASWGIVGVLGLLSQAIYRLGSLAWEALEAGLSGTQWAVLVGWTLFNGYGEGYRAFQQRFSPRVVVRALHLANHPRPLHVLLAPFFCMGLFHATKKARIIAWSTVVLVLCLIVLLRQVPQPWRGIVDAGVVLALVWGALAIIFLFLRALLTGTAPSVPAALPDSPDPKVATAS